MLEGMPEIAEQIFDMPVRLAAPFGVGGLSDVVASPAYCTAVGLVHYGLKHREARRRPRDGRWHLARVGARVKELFTTLF